MQEQVLQYFHGAMNETRTRDPDLGKVVLYQLSYHRKCVRTLVCFSKPAAKVMLFFELTKFLSKKMQKKCILQQKRGRMNLSTPFLWYGLRIISNSYVALQHN